MSRTAAEIQADITNVENAITAILKGGQEYEITSGSGMGSKRVVKMPALSDLETKRTALYAELAEVNSTRAVRIRPAW